MSCISEKTFGRIVETCFFPAFTLESWVAKNDANYCMTQILIRVTAVVAPIFYLYQVGVCLIGSLYYLLTTCFYKEPLRESLFGDDGTMTIACESLQNAVSSLFEMPQQFFTGKLVNYFGTECRFD